MILFRTGNKVYGKLSCYPSVPQARRIEGAAKNAGITVSAYLVREALKGSKRAKRGKK